MNNHPSSHGTRLVLLGLPVLAALAVGVAPACSSSNPAPPGTTGTGGASSSSGTTTTTTTTGTGGASASSSTGTGGTGGATTTTTTTTGSGTGGSDGGVACVSDGGLTGCYSCPPSTNQEFLNACAPGGDQCTHFDNATSLPFWDGGALPAP